MTAALDTALDDTAAPRAPKACRSHSPNGIGCEKPRGHRRAEHCGRPAPDGIRRYWTGQGTSRSPAWWSHRDSSQRPGHPDHSDAAFAIASRFGVVI